MIDEYLCATLTVVDIQNLCEQYIISFLVDSEISDILSVLKAISKNWFDSDYIKQIETLIGKSSFIYQKHVF